MTWAVATKAPEDVDTAIRSPRNRIPELTRRFTEAGLEFVGITDLGSGGEHNHKGWRLSFGVKGDPAVYQFGLYGLHLLDRFTVPEVLRHIAYEIRYGALRRTLKLDDLQSALYRAKKTYGEAAASKAAIDFGYCPDSHLYRPEAVAREFAKAESGLRAACEALVAANTAVERHLGERVINPYAGSGDREANRLYRELSNVLRYA